MQKAVLHYLGSLFKIGTEIFKHGQKSVVETHANETVTKVHELFSDESAIPSKYFYIFQTHIKFSLLHIYCILIAHYGKSWHVLQFLIEIFGWIFQAFCI